MFVNNFVDKPVYNLSDLCITLGVFRSADRWDMWLCGYLFNVTNEPKTVITIIQNITLSNIGYSFY
jgi:hypothetical protein